MPSAACIAEALKIQPSRLIKLIELHIYQKTWKANTSYALGDRMYENEHTYKCTQAGTSGGSKPSFNTTYGATTNDNTVVWTNDSLFYCDTEDTNITWDGKVYRRNQISLETVGSQNIEGSFDSQTLMISNVNRDLGEYIRTYDVRGSDVRIIEVFEALLANPADAKKIWKYQIPSASYDDETGKLSIESIYSENREDFPASERNRNVCIWDFDADGTDAEAADNCGFFAIKGGNIDLVNYPNADATWCDRGLRTPNGCYAHKNNRARLYNGIPLEPIRGI